MIFRDGWYYLLVTHGSCCAGANSSYNIRMGRSRKVTGPFLDNMGIDMLQGGGKLFLGSSGRQIGPGTSACSISATACRSSPATTRPISIAAASACSTSVRCSGATAGRWPATTSGGHLRDRVGADGHRARAGRAGHARRRSAAGAAAAAGRGRRRRRRSRAQRRRHLARRFRRRTPLRSRRAGRPAPSMCACRRTWCRRNRSGRSRPSPMRAAIRDRRISRSRSPAPIARSRRPRTASSSPSPPSPARRNNCGASTSSPTARIG